MIDTLLALVPDYSLAIVFGSILLAYLAIPVPASVLLLSAGSFAASDDLFLPGLLAVSCIAVILGDQLAYAVAHRVGPSLVIRLEKSPSIWPMISKSRALLQRRGTLAVLLSNFVSVIMISAIATGLFVLLRKRWKDHVRTQDDDISSDHTPMHEVAD